jgi:hypothetical protein
MEDKVKVVNLVSSRVSINVPDVRLSRVWEKKGAVKTIPFDQLEEAMYDPGVEAMFRDGILGIEDIKIKQKLGLEPEDVTEPVNIIILNDQQRRRYLTVMPFPEFKAKVQELPVEQIKELAYFAIQNELIDFEKDELLKKMVNIDVVKSIELERADKEETTDK